MIYPSRPHSIVGRVLAYRRRIAGEAAIRFTLDGFRPNDRMRSSLDRLLTALAMTLESGDTKSVVSWARLEGDDNSAIELRELVHAACMAVAAETAHAVRESFGPVMALLAAIERDVAATLRDALEEPALRATA